jgi:alkylhydroperoxidase family enzyme
VLDQVLAERLGEPVARIAANHRAAGLNEIDVAVMDFAEQVAKDATSVSAADLQRLRDLGLPQEEILDVIPVICWPGLRGGTRRGGGTS